MVYKAFSSQVIYSYSRIARYSALGEIFVGHYINKKCIKANYKTANAKQVQLFFEFE